MDCMRCPGSMVGLNAGDRLIQKRIRNIIHCHPEPAAKDQIADSESFLSQANLVAK